MRPSRATALLLAAVVAAGCGGTSKEDYEREIDQIGKTLEQQFTGIGRDIQSSGSLQRAAPQVEEGAEALDEAAAELEELEPPEDAEGAHRKIVNGIETLADDFRAAARAAAANDTDALLKLFGDIARSEGARKIAAARRELERAGYDVGEASSR